MRKHEVQSEQPKTLIHIVPTVIGQCPGMVKSILRNSPVKLSRYVVPELSGELFDSERTC